MNRKYILDKNNNPVPEPDVVKWGIWFEQSHSRRIVEQTHIGKYWVSTVFLGIDHNYGGEGDPVLWETMIFLEDNDNWEDKYCDRYTSHKDALWGHQIAILMAQKMDQKAETE